MYKIFPVRSISHPWWQHVAQDPQRMSNGENLRRLEDPELSSPTLPNFWLMPVRMESPKGSQYWELIIPTRLHLLTDMKTRIREWLQESIHVVQAPQICWHDFERRIRVSWSYTKFPKFLRNFGIVETVSLRSVREIKGLFPQHLGN